MPFLYDVSIEATEPEYKLLQHLVPVGTLVGTGQAIAVLSDGSEGAMEFHLPVPKQGLLVEWYLASGATVSGSEAIARIVAEGEEEPVAHAVLQRLG
jgi:hypothetical protein